MNLNNLINNEITQDEYLRYKNATLLLKKLPGEIGELIVRKNDINIIIINEHWDLKNRKKVFLHEMVHLEKDHTYKYKVLNDNPDIYENEVDNYISNLKFD